MSVSVTPEQMSALRATLLNTSGSTPLHERFRALFMLKAVGGDEVITIISEGTSQVFAGYHTRAVCFTVLCMVPSPIERAALTTRPRGPIAVAQARTRLCPRPTEKRQSYPDPRRRSGQCWRETLLDGSTRSCRSARCVVERELPAVVAEVPRRSSEGSEGDVRDCRWKDRV